MKGDCLFKEYWQNPDATAEAFDEEGWFCTGDTAQAEGAPAYWRILGRTSVDIIKTGGYKISAVSIENALLGHPLIKECAVFGVADDELGEVVAAVIACPEQQQPSLRDVQTFAAERLPRYQVPKKMEVLPSIPRNAMGKINKKQLRQEVFGQ